MVDMGGLSVGFSSVSGVLSLALFLIAVRTYRQERNPALAFVAGAFLIFALKSFLVAYAVAYHSIEHPALEFIDGVGDMTTIAFLTLPILWPRR